MNTSKKQINFNLNDFLPFIDGLDIAINFSLVIFLSSFLLESLDTRVAVVILCFVTSLSLISRIFDLKISRLLEKLKINKINLFLILFFLYFIPVIIQKEFPIFLSIGIFRKHKSFCRTVYRKIARKIRYVGGKFQLIRGVLLSSPRH